MADPRGPNPWLSTADPSLIAAVTAEVLSWSIRLEQACQRLQIPCFDVGNDFDHVLADAARTLGFTLRVIPNGTTNGHGRIGGYMRNEQSLAVVDGIWSK